MREGGDPRRLFFPLHRHLTRRYHEESAMEEGAALEGSDYPVCRRIVPPEIHWPAVRALLSESGQGSASERERKERAAALRLPPYIIELGELERQVRAAIATDIPHPPATLCVNPSLSLLVVTWKYLAELVDPPPNGEPASPVPGPDRILVWKDPATGLVRASSGRDGDLLALKVVVEDLDPLQVAGEAGVPAGLVDRAVDAAVARGILLRPPSRIRREGEPFPRYGWPEEFLVAPVFTLQWHITQECDLHCLHCYDRSQRSPLVPEQGMTVLRDLRSFCRERFVDGQVSFTGGNPFLYDYFDLLYREAADLGLATAILGNPVPRGRLEEILAIRRPAYFQVSLEGLPDHNDAIRGKGNFDSVLSFLGILRECGVFSIVMLTLTEENLDQVLPLAEVLRGRADRFSFNRLSMVGRGKYLVPAAPKKFEAFARSYLEAAGRNPVLGRKDNLLNLVHRERGEPLFGGCTGFGCGAAFNFLALLPDGEVHACRKFPSPVGHIGRKSLGEIYESPESRRYRMGSKGCAGCVIRPVCGGCLAVARSMGLDAFLETDPYCFLGSR
jgi:selenobiotic family peptide radical SAM maturase